jgi:hypothetical protein
MSATSARGTKLRVLLLSVAAGGMLAFASVPGHAMASAGDDGSWELGTWAISHYLGHQPDLGTALDVASGFRLGMAGSGFSYDIREDQACKERHLRDPRFVVGGNPGNDQYSFDKNDFSLFVGHGWWNGLVFANQVDAWDILGEYIRWGNWDLEWAYIMGCHFTGDNGDPTYLANDQRMLAGAHAICGFVDQGSLVGNGIAQGRTWADLIRGQGLYTYARTIIDGWDEGNDQWISGGIRIRNYYGYGCRYDYLPGEGSYSQTDPIPVESGGQPYSFIFTCN